MMGIISYDGHHHLRWVSSHAMGKITYDGYHHLRWVKSPTMGIMAYERVPHFLMSLMIVFPQFSATMKIKEDLFPIFNSPSPSRNSLGVFPTPAPNLLGAKLLPALKYEFFAHQKLITFTNKIHF